MKKSRKFLIAALVVAFVAMFCGDSVVNGQDDRAKPRDREQKQTERKRESPPPRAREPQTQRRDRDQRASEDAARRRPRPDESYRRSREHRDIDRYDWRNYELRFRGSRDRFPRFYFGVRTFDRLRYRGEVFGPHYGLWYRVDDHRWRMFFWPFSYGPVRGCRWYYVPTDRRLIAESYSSEEYWEYTEYRRLYICFD